MEDIKMTNHEMDHMHGGGMNHDQPSSPGPCKPPTCGFHNQMVVGEQTIYLSHLPMFMFNPLNHPHNFQVILEVTLSGPGDPQAVYADDRRDHPHERMYTMSPERFEMIAFDPQHPKINTLKADIFRGHLERGGIPIIEAATVHVESIVYFHEFERNAEPLDQLEYLLFGKAPDLFLAHVITRPPDFDQILGVTIDDSALSADDLKRGVRIQIPGRENTPQTRIKAGERFTSQAQLPGDETGQPLELQLEAGIEFYFEEGELGGEKFTMDQTPEEKKAGF
jgi:hypothetical protein